MGYAYHIRGRRSMMHHVSRETRMVRVRGVRMWCAYGNLTYGKRLGETGLVRMTVRLSAGETDSLWRDVRHRGITTTGIECAGCA